MRTLWRPTDAGGVGGAYALVVDLSFGYLGCFLLCLEDTQRSEPRRPESVGVLKLCWRPLMVKCMFGVGRKVVGAHGSPVVDPHNSPGVLVGSEPVVIGGDGWLLYGASGGAIPAPRCATSGRSMFGNPAGQTLPAE